jgi:hypothetical protein
VTDEPRDIKRPPPRVHGKSFVPAGAPGSVPPRQASQLVQPDGTLRCARCGSTQFTTKRSTGRKVMFGVGALLGSANQVQCVACGTTYKRH